MLGLAMLTVVVLLVMALAPWLTGLILAAAEARELATQQLRTVVGACWRWEAVRCWSE